MMDRSRLARNLVLTCMVFVGACGDSDKPQATATPAPESAVAKRCSLKAAGGDGGFPAGLLPDGAVVTAEGLAIADGKLPDVYAALQANAEPAGLEVRDTELETLDAEIELEGPDGDVGLRLGLAADCARATEIRLAD
jgi:hypothetical protein